MPLPTQPRGNSGGNPPKRPIDNDDVKVNQSREFFNKSPQSDDVNNGTVRGNPNSRMSNNSRNGSGSSSNSDDVRRVSRREGDGKPPTLNRERKRTNPNIRPQRNPAPVDDGEVMDNSVDNRQSSKPSRTSRNRPVGVNNNSNDGVDERQRRPRASSTPTVGEGTENRRRENGSVNGGPRPNKSSRNPNGATGKASSRAPRPDMRKRPESGNDLPEGWAIDAETGVKYKVLPKTEWDPNRPNYSVSHLDEDADASFDLNSLAADFLGHLQVAPSAEERKRLIAEKKRQIRLKNKIYDENNRDDEEDI